MLFYKNLINFEKICPYLKASANSVVEMPSTTPSIISLTLSCIVQVSPWPVR